MQYKCNVYLHYTGKNVKGHLELITEKCLKMYQNAGGFICTFIKVKFVGCSLVLYVWFTFSALLFQRYFCFKMFGCFRNFSVSGK